MIPMIVIYVAAVILGVIYIKNFVRIYKGASEDDKPKMIKIFWCVIVASVVVGVGVSLGFKFLV